MPILCHLQGRGSWDFLASLGCSCPHLSAVIKYSINCLFPGIKQETSTRAQSTSGNATPSRSPVCLLPVWQKSNSFSRDTGQWLQLSLLNKTLKLTDQVYNSISRLGCAFLECDFPPWLVEWGGDGEKRKGRTLALTFTRTQVRLIHYWNYFYKEHICVLRSHCHKSISGWLLILFFFFCNEQVFFQETTLCCIFLDSGKWVLCESEVCLSDQVPERVNLKGGTIIWVHGFRSTIHGWLAVFFSRPMVRGAASW